MGGPRKVVLDSDDESSDIDEQQSNHEPAAEQAHYSVGHSGSQTLEDFPVGTRSTSSSEKLRCELQNAHSKLFDPSPLANQTTTDHEESSTLRRDSNIGLVVGTDSPLQQVAPASKAEGERAAKRKASNAREYKTDKTPNENIWDVPRSTPPDMTSANRETPSQKIKGAESQDGGTRSLKRRRLMKQDDDEDIPMQPVNEMLEDGKEESVHALRKQPVGIKSMPKNGHDPSSPNDTPLTLSRHPLDNDADELGSDEIAIGLPREKYVPKPTRSRSAKEKEHNSQPGLGDTGEELPRERKRRRASENSSVENKGRLVEMGFRSSQATKALREAKGDVEKAIDILFTTTTTAAVQAHGQVNESPTEIWGNSSTEIAKPGHDAVPQSERDDDDTSNAAVIEPAAEKKQKKKGRGRPRKSEVAQQPEEVVEIVKGKGITEACSTGEDGRAPLSEIQANQESGSGEYMAGVDLPFTGEQAEQGCSDSTGGDTKPADPTGSTVKTLCEPKRQGTPANKGKVPLKVGLSRRAPVEPLLRIIRK